MKKFTTTVGVIRDINEKELSELQKSYREYFGAKMEKFGVKSPAELTEDQKKDFFNEITKDWEKGKGATEAGKKDVEEHGVTESEELNEAGVSDSADNLADSLKKNESHFATFLKPKKMNVELSGNVVTLTPASKSFTITADYNKKTVIATAKPAYPESVSYVEILEFFKSRTGFSVTNESEEVNEGVYSKTTKKFDLETAKKKTGQILSVIRSGAGIGFCQINKEGDKAFLIIKADKDDQYDIEKILSESEVIDESKVNEKDIKSAADFKEFAMDKLKKQHGDDFDEAKADKVIKALSDEAEESGDWGAAVGKLNKA